MEALENIMRLLGKYVSSVLDTGIFNELMTRVYTYNVVEVHRNGTPLR
jgi:hypothetical protein